MYDAGRRVACGVDRLLERIEDEVGAHRRGHSPAHNPSGEDIDHERDVDESRPRGDVCEVRDPELIRPGRREIPVDQVCRSWGPVSACVVVTQARPRTAPANPMARINRRTRHRATGICSRPSCFQTLCAGCVSLHTSLMPLTARKRRGRSLLFAGPLCVQGLVRGCSVWSMITGLFERMGVISAVSSL